MIELVGIGRTFEVGGQPVHALADVDEVRRRLVTTSPDVSISTNLGGWINKTGVFSPDERETLRLRGLLPAHTSTMEEQLRRVGEQLRGMMSWISENKIVDKKVN